MAKALGLDPLLLRRGVQRSERSECRRDGASRDGRVGQETIQDEGQRSSPEGEFATSPESAIGHKFVPNLDRLQTKVGHERLDRGLIVVPRLIDTSSQGRPEMLKCRSGVLSELDYLGDREIAHPREFDRP